MDTVTGSSTPGLRVVVTGASGNVGTSVVERLSRSPEIASIVGVARRRPAWEPPRTSWVRADVSADNLEPVLRDADAVVHLAWMFQPSHRPLTTWAANAQGSGRVFEAAAAAGVSTLVHASSIGAYSPGPADGHLVDESWPTDGWPAAAYTREKAYAERALDAVEARHPDLRVVRLRPTFMFKRESASEQQRIFAGRFLPHQLIRPGWIPVVPDLPGLQLQALHTSDTAEAVLATLLRPVRGAFNLGNDVLGPAELRDLIGARVTVPVPAKVARGALAALWRLRVVPTPPDLLDAFLHLPLIDDSRARRELGWVPRYSSAEALREFLQGLYDGTGMDTAPLHSR